MNVDPTQIATEVGSVWKSSPVVVGLQLVTLVMMGGLMWDRAEQRAQMTPLVLQMLNQIREQSQLLARCNPDRSVPNSLSREHPLERDQ